MVQELLELRRRIKFLQQAGSSVRLSGLSFVEFVQLLQELQIVDCDILPHRYCEGIYYFVGDTSSTPIRFNFEGLLISVFPAMESLASCVEWMLHPVTTT